MIALYSHVGISTIFAEDDVQNIAGSDELKSETHAAVVAEMKRLLDGIKIIRQRAEPVVEELVPEPILNWDDLARGHHHGTLWVWGGKGRPAAVIEVYTTVFEKKIKGWPGNVVHSLAPEGLRTAGTRKWDWAPDDPGFKPERLLDVPAPAATSKLRRLQMRTLAKRFSSNETWNASRTELRLLPSPVRLYDSDDTGTLDGGLFAFVHGGTNPEVILIIEAIQRDTENFWQFGCVRLGHAQVQVLFDDREVWVAERYGENDRKSPYYTLLP